MTKDKELLPCPFCKRDPIKIVVNGHELVDCAAENKELCPLVGSYIPLATWLRLATPDATQHTGSCPLCDQRAKDGANMDGKHCVRHKRPDFDCGSISCFDCMRIITEARKQATTEGE